jgi:hypothetical protein
MTRRAFAGIAVIVLLTGTLAGCAGAKRPAVGIRVLLGQVRKAFGDDILRSASVNGSKLTVRVAYPNHPLSNARAGFEAVMLAAAFHDSVSASGRTPPASVNVINTNGVPVPGVGVPNTAGSDLRRLAPGKCKRVAQTVMASFLQHSIRSAVTLPYAGGGCAFTFQAPVGGFDPQVLGDLGRKIGDSAQRPFFVEVDDFDGVPWFVASSTPGGGSMEGATPGSGLVVGSGPVRAPRPPSGCSAGDLQATSGRADPSAPPGRPGRPGRCRPGSGFRRAFRGRSGSPVSRRRGRRSVA